MGLPTLRGSFVGGDDHRLLLNHVLVNHPSVKHALQLFTIFHRDLYQPLPLLSFQFEFLVATKLGLFDQSVAGGARLFHLTNILLHAINALLVWFVVRRLHRDVAASTRAARWADPPGGTAPFAAPFAVATAAAILFAVHPLQTEVVAWTNGRMILLSTLFGLLSLLTFGAWLDRPRTRFGVLTVLLVVCCAISKVRIGLPVLLAIVAVARGKRPKTKDIVLWMSCAVVTAVFVFVNVRATAGADLFAEAAEHLKGPRLVRVLLALSNYFTHVVWPVGLASYYPTPPVVHWSDPTTFRAAAATIPVLIALGVLCRRSRVAQLGTLWFFSTIAVTLPFLPARNVLAADRYMYLPIIGLLWVLAAGGRIAFRAVSQRRPRTAVGAVVIGAAVVLPTLIGVCWHVERFYETPLSKTQRIADLFPNTPRVWERVGWSHYRAGRYETAIECARRELTCDSPNVQSGAYQLMGLSEVRRGRPDDGLALLKKAIEIDPDNALGRLRLGMAYDELGRPADAVRYYEKAVDMAPGHNPTINRLATMYRGLGRRDDARAMYEKELANNPYEVPASMGLVELDIEAGAPESLADAESRLRTLLSWMPENAAALTNLGVVLVATGRPDEAIEAYRRAIDTDPNNVTALLNLARLYEHGGDVESAGSLYERAAHAGLTSIDEAVFVHEFCVSQGKFERAVALWRAMTTRFVTEPRAAAFLAWSRALAGDVEASRTAALDLLNDQTTRPLALATLAYIDFEAGQYESAASHTDTLCQLGDRGDDARKRWLGALERFDTRRPNVAWTYCLVARLAVADHNLEPAGFFLDRCTKRCRDDACRAYAQRLRTALTPPTVP